MERAETGSREWGERLNISGLICAIQDWANDFVPVRSVFLLGSTARGQNRPYSDLDIVIETDLSPSEQIDKTRLLGSKGCERLREILLGVYPFAISRMDFG